jgi:hypothetical protein
MKKISYSQYSTWSGCPQKYKLQYVDRLGETGGNIHFVFGTAMHEVIQTFLEMMYNKSKKAAMELDLHAMLLVNMKKEFIKYKEDQKGVPPCTQEDLEEAFGDGRKALTQFRSKLSKLYSKSGYALLGIELELKAPIKGELYFIGFIDVILKDVSADKVIIIDIKTSTKGWSKWQKNDKVKTSQMLLYKKFYSDLYDVPYDKINVEYHIFKRKIDEAAQYPIPRISKFVPANGKPSMNQAWAGFMNFVDAVFNEDGTYKDFNARTNQTILCGWCEFKERKLCKDFK